MILKKFAIAAVVMDVMLGAEPVMAETKVYNISIKDHKFEPAEVKIPADEKVKLLVKNLDSTPEEFESHDLSREKIIKGGAEATVFVGPLKPGKYEFFGEFNPTTARGFVVVE